MPNDLYTAQEVADQAGVSIATISRAATSGDLKTHWQAPGPNGMRLFHARDVRKWLKTRKAAS